MFLLLSLFLFTQNIKSLFVMSSSLPHTDSYFENGNDDLQWLWNMMCKWLMSSSTENDQMNAKRIRINYNRDDYTVQYRVHATLSTCTRFSNRKECILLSSIFVISLAAENFIWNQIFHASSTKMTSMFTADMGEK